MSGAWPVLLLGDDPRHGVGLHARQVATAVARVEPRVQIGSDEREIGDGPVHLHFTDRLWGASPASAADRVVALAARRRLTVTLHDVPQASDGADSLTRRRAAYRAVAAAADRLVVSSFHERSLLAETGTLDAGAIATTEVIPLFVAPAERPEPGGATTDPVDDVVALLGWFYPGKGHAAAIDAVAAAPPPRPAVRALGASAPGHDHELASLIAAARRQGVDFAATGWLPAAELADRARRAAVPLAAHAHVSASGSINSWIALGRIPLVADSRYAREIERLRPGTIRRYRPDALAAEIDRARRRPGLSRARPGVATRPHLDDVAARYLRFWAGG